MAAPAFETAGTGTQTSTGGTSVTITKPTGVAAGDLLIALVHTRGSNPVPPSGWTVIRDAVVYGTWWRIADAADVAASSYVWTYSTANRASGVILRISGAHATTPVDTHSYTGAVANNTATTVTTGQADSLLIFGSATRDGLTAYTAPASMTERAQPSAGTATTVSSRQEVATEAQAAAGASGDRTATNATAENRLNYLIAVKPVAGGTPATVSAVAATATADVPAPVVTAAATVTAPAATATGAASPPTVGTVVADVIGWSTSLLELLDSAASAQEARGASTQVLATIGSGGS